MANSEWFRTILGFVVAPISPGLVAVILAAPFRVGASRFGLRELSEATWIIGLSAALGYPVAVVFGVPLYIFLGRVAGTACWSTLHLVRFGGSWFMCVRTACRVLLDRIMGIRGAVPR